MALLVGFIGCPCSGKTTTAAMTFADLKTMGISTEFIPEQARQYIAIERFFHTGNGQQPLTLNDVDQLQIMKQQELMEKVFIGSTEVVLTDSCVLNTLLYMSPEMRNSEAVKGLVEKAVTRYDLVFYSGPVKPPLGQDMNRIHDYQQSLIIDSQIPTMLKEFAPGWKPFPLLGTPESRYQIVTKAVLQGLLA